MKLKIQARAKINWTLDVVGTLPNGYHDLDMLMQSVTLCDQMTMEEAPQLTLYVRAQGRSFVPADGNNLVLKAAAALQAATGCTRGEPYVGMVAVGAVVLNRVKSSRFPNTMAGVIYQSGAFDAVSDGQINLAPGEQSRRAARDAMNGWDPTGGCLYYYNPATATSSWIWSREVRLSIGDHSFAI